MPQTLPIHHSVSLRQAQARRLESAPRTSPVDPEPGFEDTVPLWFRSEAFAEDIDAVESQPSEARPHWNLDAQVLAAGAAVLRMTLAALKAPPLPPVPPVPNLPRSSRRAVGWV